MTTLPNVKLEKRFLEACIVASAKPAAKLSPLSKTTRLTDKYPNAYSDFVGGGTPCVFKSGPSWPVDKGPQPVWLDIGTTIIQALDSEAIKWTSIGPRAYANAGEFTPFCPFMLRVGVVPNSLLYEDAVAAAPIIEEIFTKAGFSCPEIAFVESLITRSAGPKLLAFNPLLDNIYELRKPFTPTIGLAIAPSEYPYYEGTASLYYRLSKEDESRIAVLTCAHVARPPPIYPNTGLTEHSRHHEEIVALGTMAYNKAVKSIMTFISNRLKSIDIWNHSIQRLEPAVEGEDSIRANKLHDEVTKNFTTLEQRTIGRVLHSEKIEVSVEPHRYTNDWALIELYKDKIDWDTFRGNKVFVGGNFLDSNYGNLMFPQFNDRKNYTYPKDSLLPALGVVQDNEFRKPQHLDVNGDKCLLVIKNGLATGTTVVRVNGLESFTRDYDKDYDISHRTSIEFAVLRYWSSPGKFSDGGDSGSIILDREGRIVGILTGGEGPTDQTDTTYLTPYWWVEQQIKAKFPGIALYDVAE